MNNIIYDILLFRMTHIDNIPHIVKYGVTHKNSKNANPVYKNIGDISLINSRATKIVSITNGTPFELKKIILGDYTPFYFGVKMPMLYVIQHGGNFTNKIHPSNIVYLVCSLQKIIQLQHIEYYFCDGHATDNLTIFYDKSMINSISKILDWNSINTQYWGGEQNLDLKRKKQAEFLVKGDLPVDVIQKFICYDKQAKQKLIKYKVSEEIIDINKNAYF